MEAKELEKHPQHEAMAKIIAVRYTDIEKEKYLCESLLKWARANEDSFAEAYAQVYLGDYYMAKNNYSKCGSRLMKAKRLMGEERDDSEDWRLRLRLYALLGLFYELKADEQNAIQYYMETIVLARRLGDVAAQRLILNNIAYAFEHHQDNDRALAYYKEACSLPAQENDPNACLLYSNMMELFLRKGELEEAKRYIEMAEKENGDPEMRVLCRMSNWCCYYAAAGDAEQAEYWAEQVLAHPEQYRKNHLSAFEHYHTLCKNMLKLGCEKYIRIFLEQMEGLCGGGLEQQRMLEECRVEYALHFATEQQKNEAYRAYYRMHQELEKKGNQAIASAMKAELGLEKALRQKASMQTEQEALERQVNRDELTGVYSRRYLDNMLRGHGNGLTGECLGIVMLDVDYFKEYNDFYGHRMGDDVLRAVGSCLKKNRVEGVFPCRYGGDEFVCICDGLDDGAMVRYLQAVRADLHSRAMLHEKSACCDRVTLSIGYAVECAKNVQPNTLLQIADRALYDSKYSGRNALTRGWVGEV